MAKSDYTVDELSSKIETAKAELKEMEELLRWYEEELEHKKQDVPLGIPAERKAYVGGCFLNCCGEAINQPLDPNDKYDQPMFNMLAVFTSEASAMKHAEMLLVLRKALVANSKGEPIDIKVLLPLLPKGHWVACDSSGTWFVFSCKPFIKRKAGSKDEGIWDSEWHAGFMGFLPLNLKPAENWETSLMECGL